MVVHYFYLWEIFVDLSFNEIKCSEITGANVVIALFGINENISKLFSATLLFST